MKAYIEAGADGFGLGSALFTPAMSVEDIGRNANDFAAAWRALRAG
jgi:2-dehydro-3-deoxyphosphogalactonate aldolase